MLRALLPILLLPALLMAPSQRGRAEEHALKMAPASMDQRTPLPLPAMMAEHQKQNMREHLAAVQAIIAAISRDDMDGVAKAADRIGYSETMGQA
jgi:hypothetical protein